MAVLALVFVVACAVWIAVLVRFRPSVPAGFTFSLLVASIVCGVVFGFDFFHRDVGPIPVTIDRVLLAIAAGLAIYEWAINRDARTRLAPLDIAVLAWFVVLAASTLVTDFGYKDKLPLSRLVFFNAIPLIGFVVARNCRLSEQQLRTLLWVFVGVGAYLGATALAEWTRWYSLVFPRYIASPQFVEFFGRGRGPLLNPVINGILLTISGCSSLLLWRTGRWPARSCLACVFLLAAIGVYTSMTRSVWIGFAISVLLVVSAPLTWRTRVRFFAAIGLAGIVVYFAIGASWSRFKRDEFVSAEEMTQSATLRPLLAIVAWEMFQDRPLTGVGFGQYGKFKRPYHWHDEYDRPLQAALPYMQHNVAFSYLTETGLLGLGCLSGVLLLMGRRGFRLWSNPAQNSAFRDFGLLSCVVLLAYLINGMFHDVSIVPMANCLLLFIAGTAEGAIVRENSTASDAVVTSQVGGNRNAILGPTMALKVNHELEGRSTGAQLSKL